MSLAFEEVFAVSRCLRGHRRWRAAPTRGFSRDAAAAHGIPARRLRRSPASASVYVRHLAHRAREAGRARKGLMPGVRELLDALAPRDDVYLALLTGNYEAGARLKLEYFDLWRYFSCGAFGDDAPHRNGLVPKALAARRGVRRAVVRRRGRRRHRRHAARRRLRRARRRALDRASRPEVTRSRSCARRARTRC